MAIPISELQSLSPTAVIELYKLELNTLLHGSNQVFLFHAGCNQINQSIIWQDVSYDKYPIIAEGFEFTGQGTLPRPTLTISNMFGFVSGLIQDTNALIDRFAREYQMGLQSLMAGTYKGKTTDDRKEKQA